MLKNIQAQSDALTSIQVQKNVITCESLAFFRPHSKTLDRLGQYYGDTTKYINDAIQGLLGAKARVAIDGTTFVRKVTAANYVELSGLKLTFPVEINCDYLTAVKALESVAVVSDSFYRDVLDPFAIWLAKAVNDPAHMESVGQFTGISTQRSKQGMGALMVITRGGGLNSTRYSRAIKRNADWGVVIKTLNDLNARSDATVIDAVHKKVNEIQLMLKLLIDKMNEPRFEYRPSGKFVDTLVATTYAMAEEVEFFTQYCYVLSKITECVRLNVDEVTKALA